MAMASRTYRAQRDPFEGLQTAPLLTRVTDVFCPKKEKEKESAWLGNPVQAYSSLDLG